MDEEDKSTMLERFLGRDPMKIPCFRNTFLYSISSYFGVGLLTFLFTSKPQFSSHVGIGAFTVVTLGYFGYCRYEYSNQQFNSQRLQEFLHQAVVSEGVEKEEAAPKLQDA